MWFFSHRMTSVKHTMSRNTQCPVRTFPNQKPWVDRTIRAAVNKRTAAYNASLLSGNMSEYKASCYALRHAVRAAKLRYRERIESHFQLNDSRRMWQGLRTICAYGNKSSAEVRADPLLADELNTFYGLLSGNMSEYNASCYALRRAERAAKLRYRERIESHFQLNDSRRMWQGLRTICAYGNKSSAEVRADPLLANELNTYGRFQVLFVTYTTTMYVTHTEIV